MKQGTICVGNTIFEVLLALSEEEQSSGLMGVKPPTPNMAFVYDYPRVNKFWMHNTPAPLDIVFCHQGKISQICKGEPYSTVMIGDDKPSDLVVEFPRGTAAASDMKIGQLLEIVEPDRHELKKIFAQNKKFFSPLRGYFT